MISRLLESKFDQCDESCGWIAAFIAALAYGSFGVPVKETLSVQDVHPFILQSYKTITMFVMSWLVLFMGETLRYSPWGLLSGLLWVLGGTGGIYAIRNAGMAIAVGTWSSVMILVNFLFGICFFHEPVASFWSTCGAFVCLGIGLVGMAVYSAKPTGPTTSTTTTETSNPLIGSHDAEDEQQRDNGQQPQTQEMVGYDRSTIHSSNGENQITSRITGRSRDQEDGVMEMGYDPLEERQANNDLDNSGGLWRDRCKKKALFIMGTEIGFTKRELGIFGAVMNGVLTGSSLVPIHYAKKQGFGGAAYMFSFAAGALLANVLLWVLWFLGRMIISRKDASLSLRMNAKQTYESMPQWYFKQLWIPGFSAGILLAIAMFGSIMSVTYLGQGVGNSIIQSKIIISGLYGVFWYKEITGGATIAKWFSSAAITICGILWLSFERIHARVVAAGH